MIFVSPETGDLLKHIELALVEHRRWCRTNGIAWPADLEAFFVAILSARSGQQRTSSAPLVEIAHAAPMQLVVDYETAAATLSVSSRTVRRLVSAGELPAVDIGGSRRIRTADLHEYVTRRANT